MNSATETEIGGEEPRLFLVGFQAAASESFGLNQKKSCDITRFKQEKNRISAVQATTKSGFFVKHHRNQQQEQVDLSEIEQPKQN